METTLLEIKGMNCNACVGHVERALKSVPGVTAVRVDLAKGSAAVDHDGADAAVLCAAVDEEGYDAAPAT